MCVQTVCSLSSSSLSPSSPLSVTVWNYNTFWVAVESIWLFLQNKTKITGWQSRCHVAVSSYSMSKFKILMVTHSSNTLSYFIVCLRCEKCSKIHYFLLFVIICAISCSMRVSVTLFQTGQISDLVLSKSVTDYKGVHFTPLSDLANVDRLVGWQKEKLYPCTLIQSSIPMRLSVMWLASWTDTDMPPVIGNLSEPMLHVLTPSSDVAAC